MTASPGVGHLLPVLPIAVAAAGRGHDVRVAIGSDLEPLVVRAGLRPVAIGPPSLPAAFGRIEGLRELAGRRRLLALVSQGFANILATEFADGVALLATTWRPDVIVREDMEMGSWIAAERLAIPTVVIQATAWRPLIRRAAGQSQNALRARLGLEPDPDLAGHDGALWFTTRPPSLRDPSAPMPANVRELRPAADDRIGATSHDGVDVPDWLAADPGRPRVAVTLGTVNADRIDLIRPIVEGLAGLDLEVIVALGADPSTLGSVPANVRVERYVPMSELLPRSALVIHHAGSGTMLAAAAAGTPQVMIPIAADQPDNAALCVRAGIAVALEPRELTAAVVAAAATRLLVDTSFIARARAVATQIEAMPDAKAAIAEIETLR